MTRFGARWARATDAVLPHLDVGRGVERLLGVEYIGTPRRGRGLRLGMAMAAFTGMTAMLLSLHAIHPYKFAIDDRLAAAGIRPPDSTAEQSLLFSDGSSIMLAPGSSVGVRGVDERGAQLALERGSVKADIATRPDAKWTIEAGPFELEVRGTAFEVEWLPELQHFAVSVARESVFVNGPMLGDGQPIAAGTRCTVDWRQARFMIEPTDAPGHGAETEAWRGLEGSPQLERAVDEAQRIGPSAAWGRAAKVVLTPAD